MISNENKPLNNNITRIILLNFLHKYLTREDLKIKNSSLLNHCLYCIHNQTFLKPYLQIDASDKFICNLNYNNILTTNHIQNHKQKVEWRLLEYIATSDAYYLGNFKIAFHTPSKELEIYSYDKDTFALTFIKTLDSFKIEQFLVLKNKRIILAHSRGQLALLERNTFNTLLYSIEINSQVYKFLEVGDGRFITANYDRRVRLWCANSLSLIKVITDFGIENVVNLHCLIGLKNRNIYSEVKHLNSTGDVIITHGIWNIDDTAKYKVLLQCGAILLYKFCETGNFLILARKNNFDLNDNSALGVRLYSAIDYSYLKLVYLGLFSDITSVGDDFLLVYDDYSIKLLEAEGFKCIDEIDIQVNKLAIGSDKATIVVETLSKTIMFKLNKSIIN
jgi:hypothetical protein